MKIPVLNGSPRSDGNTAALLLSSGSDGVYDGAVYEYRNSFLDHLKLEDMGIVTAFGKQSKSAEKLAEAKALGSRLL